MSGETTIELRRRGHNARSLAGGIAAWHAIGGATAPIDTGTYASKLKRNRVLEAATRASRTLRSQVLLEPFVGRLHMTNLESCSMNRRTLLTGPAVLGATATVASNISKAAVGQQIMATVEQNTTKRRGVGLRAFNPTEGNLVFWTLRYGEDEIARARSHGWSLR